MQLSRYLIQATLIIVLCTVCWQRAGVYKNMLLLWQDTVTKSPNKSRVRNNYGYALKDAGDIDEAARQFELAIQLEPTFAEALNNLATIYSSRGQKMEALSLLKKSAAAKPGLIDTRYNLALLYYQLGLKDEALQECAFIIQRWPLRNEAVFARNMLLMIQKEQPAK